METVEVLNKMKDALMEYGWGRRVLQDNEGKLCLMGARNKVLGYSMDQNRCEDSYKADYISDLIESFLPANCRRLDDTCSRLWMYNDRVAKSFNDVINVIDQAILVEKERATEG